jgi:mono/diheme cytochrome c family protein
MKPMAILFTGTVALFFSTLSQAGNPENGKTLHDDANCMRCHADKPYDPSKTTNYEKLVKAVNFCNTNLNTGWFDDEVEDVAAYLNQEFYKFKQ